MTFNPEPVLAHGSPDAVTWQRAHPAFMVTALLRNLRGFILPFLLVVIGNSGRESRTGTLIFLGISAVVLLLSGIGSVVQWWFYRYALTPDRLLVHSGIIFKQERAIPYQRIQTVDLEEAPLDRLLGVARMKIETAAGGGGESEVELKAVRRDAALALREQLLRARQTVQGDVAPEPGAKGQDDETVATRVMESSGELVRKLPLSELLLAGATSGTIGPAAAIIGVGIQFADDIVPQAWWNRVPWDQVTGASTNLSVIAGVVIVIAIFAWVVAIAGTVLTYYGFELRRDGEHLVVQYGLLDRRRTTIPIRRIQAIRIEEGLLRQPFGYATVRYESAGRAGAAEGGSGTLFPMMPRNAVRNLLAITAPEFAVDVDRPRLERLPRRSLPRYIVADSISSLLVVILSMAGIRFWQDGLPWWGYLPLLWVPVVVLLGWLSFRDAGWKLDANVLLLRTRGAARSTLVTPRRRIQYRQTTANPLQRRADLVTLQIAIASGGLGGHYSLPHMDVADGNALLLALTPRHGARQARS